MIIIPSSPFFTWSIKIFVLLLPVRLPHQIHFQWLSIAHGLAKLQLLSLPSVWDSPRYDCCQELLMPYVRCTWSVAESIQSSLGTLCCLKLLCLFCSVTSEVK